MTNLERELLKRLIIERQKYHDDNPDVGRGCFNWAVFSAQEIVKELNFLIDRKDIMEICDEIDNSGKLYDKNN